MPMYLVKTRQVIEWEQYYDVPDPGVAEETARLETRHHGTIVDEDVIVGEVQPSEVVD